MSWLDDRKVYVRRMREAIQEIYCGLPGAQMNGYERLGRIIGGTFVVILLAWATAVPIAIAVAALIALWKFIHGRN